MERFGGNELVRFERCYNCGGIFGRESGGDFGLEFVVHQICFAPPRLKPRPFKSLARGCAASLRAHVESRIKVLPYCPMAPAFQIDASAWGAITLTPNSRPAATKIKTTNKASALAHKGLINSPMISRSLTSM